MANSTLRNATDAWTNGDKPSRNYGDARILSVRSGDRQAWLFFNRAAPKGATITAATLRVVYAATWAGSRTLTVARANESWKASRLTHDNRPGTTGATATASAPAGPAGTVVEFDVKALLQTVSDGGSWYGLRLTSNSATSADLGSANGSSDLRPTLFVEWSEAPEPPTTLRPSGDAAVSVNKPILRFDFNDVLGDTTLAAVQVQIDPAANWTTPAWDSGEVATTDSELDLTTTSYAGLANNASTWWRVRVKDGAGLWSGWSDDEQFRRVDLGTLTITNPAAVSPVVLEPTPPFLWTYSDTIARWRVRLSKANDPSTTLKNGDSGERTSSATAWTPPNGVLTGDGPYRVTVDVWDDEDREAVPNGESHRTAHRDFTVADDAGVIGVTGLALSQPVADRNTVRLTWTRSTAPDNFVLRRDGEVVAEPLPGDVLVSGTTYVYDDELAAPWASHTWTVQAVVNGAASSRATSSMALPKSRGIWLLDGSKGLAVWLAGMEQGTIAQPEEASVFAPVGSSTVVRRVQAQRGYEGNLGGLLVDRAGLTADESAANLRAMRDQPTRPVALVVGGLAIKVVLGNINITPTPQGNPPQRAATFDFWEAPAT